MLPGSWCFACGMRRDDYLISGLSGGSQLPFWHTQPEAGADPTQVPSFVDVTLLVVGGSQLPLTHVQPTPGCTVVQLVGVTMRDDPGGSQLPF